MGKLLTPPSDWGDSGKMLSMLLLLLLKGKTEVEVVVEVVVVEDWEGL
jgi:hypothetical protein